MARLKDRYREEIAPALKDRFEIQNPMRIPKLEKIVVNMGVGEASQDSRRLDGAMEDLARITGQKPQLRRARKSIAGFKIRDGMPVGARVTLRGERMWEFLDRLITIALPRVRDFRGISPRSFDGRGNFALGLREQTIFPEISYDSIDTTRGLDVAVVTTAETDEEARELLRMLGMPFRTS
jgi:large subunit ribosomal protein L5